MILTKAKSAFCISQSFNSPLCRLAQSFYEKFHPRIRDLQLNVYSESKFSGRLSAMRHSTESQPRYAA
jgi:hypothetical protein